MKLPLNIAIRLQSMLQGEEILASSMKQTLILKMVDDGVVKSRYITKTKHRYYIDNKENLENYLSVDFGIRNLSEYIQQLKNPDITRSDAVKVASDSKLRNIRTFKGFLINSLEPVCVKMRQQEITLQPTDGIFHFIHDYESFEIPANITVVGIENAENFRHVNRQQQLFRNITPLFISRYPQNKDAIRWLKNIPNNYLHFGDLDFAGIRIFMHEYRKHLGDRAKFYIPDNIGYLLKTYGNERLYNTQLYRQPALVSADDAELAELIRLMHTNKKGLEQEVFINLD